MKKMLALAITSIIFYLLALFSLYSFWRQFKKYQIGDKLTNDFVKKSGKHISVFIILFISGLVTSLSSIFVS
ncbi:hypothetical protein [Alkalihalobacillus pseudalcaliphilus]|uniref:hypothetical protein n=1 Tax=Alkalihalobacillus pseudalcaliphilus TaxID=79884 RepID=UPI00064D81AF|nr:hypothetical protein [Alkalihalobacillus pseudalcaliphilus]KMK74345.1 hypothetical protein AB990_20730 [Alkalihalobacillus pseudalcaliphilus]